MEGAQKEGGEEEDGPVGCEEGEGGGEEGLLCVGSVPGEGVEDAHGVVVVVVVVAVGDGSERVLNRDRGVVKGKSTVSRATVEVAGPWVVISWSIREGRTCVRRRWELLASGSQTAPQTSSRSTNGLPSTAWGHLPILCMPCWMAAKTRLKVNHDPVADSNRPPAPSGHKTRCG